MIRGDVCEYALGNARVRVLVVSANAYNPRHATYALVVEQPAPTRPTLSVVPTAPGDPVRGVVDLRRLRPLVEDNVTARIGRMSRDSMARVDGALRDYLDL